MHCIYTSVYCVLLAVNYFYCPQHVHIVCDSSLDHKLFFYCLSNCLDVGIESVPDIASTVTSFLSTRSSKKVSCVQLAR